MIAQTCLLLPLLAWLALQAAPARAADTPAPLGRLFLTPEDRETLDRQRHLSKQETGRLEGDKLRLDGIVLRSSGQATVWINGQPQTGNAHDNGVAVLTSPRHPGRATLSTGTHPPTEIKVGSTIVHATHETADGLAGGEIRVGR